MKTCTKCNETKDVEQFYKNKTGKDGRLARCIECVKEESAVAQERKAQGLQLSRAFPESNVSCAEEEHIECKMIDALRELQDQHNVDIYTSVRAGLVDRFSALRRVKK